MSRERILFVVVLVLFVGLATYQLALPGLHYDEAFEAVPAMQLVLGQPVTTFRGNGILICDRLFPLMTQDYIGAINTYAAIPFFLLLGINPISLRMMAVAIALLTLWLTCRLANALYGRSVSVLAGLLLAVNPTFVFWSRQGVFVTSATAAIGLGAALAWLYWWRTGARRYAMVGAFLLGLGLYTKLLFLWLIIALGLGVLLLNLNHPRRVIRRLVKGPVGWSGLAFLLGSAPLIIYNLQTGGTLRSVGENITTSYYGTNNLAVFSNLLERLTQLVAVLTGSHFWYLGTTYANWLNLGLFLVALGITLWFAIGPDQEQTRRVLFPFIVIGGVVAASCATVSALWVTHFAILSPWPPLAIAAAADLLVRRSGLRLAKKWANLVLALVSVTIGASWLAEVVTDVRYHRELAISGGLGAHSDAVEELARWLAAGERYGVPVAAMDWGIAAPVAFLTLGDVTPVEAFGYDWETDADFATRLERFIDSPASIYLWRAPDEIIFDRSDDFERLYEARGLEEDILEAFYERSGRPVLGATRLVPQGTAVNPPQPHDSD
jgi:4-amino-4-deoxy-L-arabinose transferase-like glycosyltransferase